LPLAANSGTASAHIAKVDAKFDSFMDVFLHLQAWKSESKEGMKIAYTTNLSMSRPPVLWLLSGGLSCTSLVSLLYAILIFSGIGLKQPFWRSAMCSRGDMQYFLKVERIILDQHLKTSLERTAGLRIRAIMQRDIVAADEVAEMERMLSLLRRRLRKLTSQTARRTSGARNREGVAIDV
jgi:hypothetical protein